MTTRGDPRASGVCVCTPRGTCTRLLGLVDVVGVPRYTPSRPSPRHDRRRRVDDVDDTTADDDARVTMRMMSAMCVIGCDGYLGQFIAREGEGAYARVYAMGRRRRARDDDDDGARDDDDPTTTSPTTRMVRVGGMDVTSYTSCMEAMTRVYDDAMRRGVRIEMVVNCAAASSPGACERAPDVALAVNAPREAWRATREVARMRGCDVPFWVQLSTDHVYDGARAMSDEDVKRAPVNAYGRSKVACEDALAEDYDDGAYVILRSSIITGPRPPLHDVDRTLFLEFVASALTERDEPTSFYYDEFRCPIAAVDISRVVVRDFGSKFAAPRVKPPRSVYNMGGPDRVNRVDMAKACAKYLAKGDDALERAYAAKIHPASCVEASSTRGVAAPPDISMDSSALVCDICQTWAPMSFAEQVKDALK